MHAPLAAFAPLLLSGLLLVAPHPHADAVPVTASAASSTSAATPTDEAQVMAVVNRLFEGMRARDGAMVASVFHPEARLATAGTGPDGAPRVQFTPIEGFVEAVGGEGDPWNEPIFRTEVRVDGNLAHVWTFYRFYAGERFSHCGYNAILLVRGDEAQGGWQILHLADTRRTEDCDP